MKGKSIFKFMPCEDGLYYLDVNTIDDKNKNQISSYNMSILSSKNNIPTSSNACINSKHINLLNTIEDNKSLYSTTQISRANRARKLQQELG